MIDIVLDIETLGTRPGCSVIEIGACAVDADGGAIVGNFSRRVRSGYSIDCVRKVADGVTCFGWKIERATAAWWLADPERAKTLAKIMSGEFYARTEDEALTAFGVWFAKFASDPKSSRIWANGPSFDIAILDESYRDNGIARPWICWQERCVRTALEMAGYVRGSVAWEEPGPRHRALNDARHEARKLWRSGALGTVSEVAKRLRQRGTVGEKVRGES